MTVIDCGMSISAVGGLGGGRGFFYAIRVFEAAKHVDALRLRRASWLRARTFAERGEDCDGQGGAGQVPARRRESSFGRHRRLRGLNANLGPMQITTLRI